MLPGYFITGTDTGVGKTWVSLAVMRYFSLRGAVVAGMKPVASGSREVYGQLRNNDALLIQQHSSLALDYNLINPYAYALAVSPHIAGVNDPADLGVILSAFESLQASADTVIVEGAGGWYSPLSLQMDNADLAKALSLPVIMVVAIRLGCINQARLSLAAILQTGLECAGWVAVCIDPDIQAKHEVIDYLKVALEVPLLGVIPFMNDPQVDLMAACISFKLL